MIDAEDRQLVEETLQGNVRGYERIVEKYQKPIYNLAYRMTRDTEDARDICQNVFIKAYEALGSFNFKSKFFSWIYRIALNESINACKSRKRHEPLDSLSDVASAADPVGALAEDEISREIRRSIDELRPEHKALIVLKYYQGLSYLEIAEITALTDKKVKSRLFSARCALKVILDKKGVFK